MLIKTGTASPSAPPRRVESSRVEWSASHDGRPIVRRVVSSQRGNTDARSGLRSDDFELRLFRSERRELVLVRTRGLRLLRSRRRSHACSRRFERGLWLAPGGRDCEAERAGARRGDPRGPLIGSARPFGSGAPGRRHRQAERACARRGVPRGPRRGARPLGSGASGFSRPEGPLRAPPPSDLGQEWRHALPLGGPRVTPLRAPALA